MFIMSGSARTSGTKLLKGQNSSTVGSLIVATGERCDVMHEAIRNRNGGPYEA